VSAKRSSIISLKAASEILELTELIVDQTIELRKQYKIKLPDAIIASTALIHGFDLISRNTNDFKNIPTLKVLDPHLF
jgi:predicted nucleic acid-binding protein